MPRPKKSDTAKDARERIVDAFWNNARTTPIRQISIGLLAAEAGCNRSTLYYYFNGIDDLVEYAFEQTKIREKLGQSFAAHLSGNHDESDWQFDSATFDDLCTFAYLNRFDIERIGAVEKMHRFWEESTGIAADSLSPEHRALLEFAIQGFIGMVAYRGSTGNAIPHEALAALLHERVMPSLSAIILENSTPLP